MAWSQYFDESIEISSIIDTKGGWMATIFPNFFKKNLNLVKKRQFVGNFFENFLFVSIGKSMVILTKQNSDCHIRITFASKNLLIHKDDCYQFISTDEAKAKNITRIFVSTREI
jgi:hypothetical protein